MLLALVAAASIVGSVVTQQHAAEFYPQRYGPFWGKWVVILGVHDLYRAPWFLALLGFLAVNIGACALHRFRARALPITSTVTHISLILILAGGAVDFAWGEDGYIQLSRGSQTDEFVDRSGQPRKLGFGMRLLEFRIEAEPVPERILLFKGPRSKEPQSFILDGRAEYLSDEGYRLRVLKDLPEFSQASGIPEDVRKVEALRGPALLLEVADPGGRSERRWLFGANPNVDINSHADRSVKTMYALRPVPRDFVSSLSIREGERDIPGVVRSNAPFRYGGFEFTQVAYDEQSHAWSAMRVTREPGTPAVLIGLVLLMGGVTVRIVLTLIRTRREARV